MAVVLGEVDAALEHDVLPDERRLLKRPTGLHVFALVVQQWNSRLLWKCVVVRIDGHNTSRAQ